MLEQITNRGKSILDTITIQRNCKVDDLVWRQDEGGSIGKKRIREGDQLALEKFKKPTYDLSFGSKGRYQEDQGLCIRYSG